jgi:hypothetical protein
MEPCFKNTNISHLICPDMFRVVTLKSITVIFGYQTLGMIASNSLEVLKSYNHTESLVNKYHSD